MTDKTREREAFAKYIAECDELAIVPDAAGAFNWAWQAATARAMAEAVRVCEEQFDHDEQAKADAASRTAKGVSSQLQRLRHWSTVSTYNAAVSRCVTAIKEALK